MEHLQLGWKHDTHQKMQVYQATRVLINTLLEAERIDGELVTYFWFTRRKGASVVSFHHKTFLGLVVATTRGV